MKATLYVIVGPWTGRLAILPRPRGGDWLEDEVQAWREAGIDVVVSALEVEEAGELDLRGENEACRLHGVEFVSSPIADRGVPEGLAGIDALLHRLESLLQQGKTVGVHCRQGVGRSALLAAGLLVCAGLGAPMAFKRIEAARGCPVPDTAEQRNWVERFAKNLKPAPAKG